jgi:hypothetical protein
MGDLAVVEGSCRRLRSLDEVVDRGVGTGVDDLVDPPIDVEARAQHSDCIVTGCLVELCDQHACPSYAGIHGVGYTEYLAFRIVELLFQHV